MSLGKLGAGVLMMGLALSASAGANNSSPTTEPGTKTGTKPTAKARHWYQVGIASWYGSHFQGRKTATGEKFDMNQMTCAHPTLPLGTWLRVTNLKNHKATYVRVNDRGPVIDGRIVDLSFAAARAVGLSGIGRVKLEPVHQNDPELAKALVAQLQVPDLFDPLPLVR